MPVPLYQPPSYVLSPSLSPQNTSNPYPHMQPTYSLSSVPRDVTGFGEYDACQNFIDEPVQDYGQDTQTDDIYEDAATYQSGPQPLDYWQAVSAISAPTAHIQPLGNQFLHSSRHPHSAQWGNPSISTPTGPSAAESSYSQINCSYMSRQTSTAGRRSRSSEAMPSPSPYNLSHLSSPRTPNLVHMNGAPPQIIDGHREQLRLFKEALGLPLTFNAGPFVPQKMYMPHTNSDRRRYVEEIELQQPIYFWMESPDECGISLIDALHSRVRRLRQRDEAVFEGRGPSISVRIQWPGYRPWSRQIPTKDFRSPPQPITKAKLAKNIAKCVERFLSARTGTQLEDEVDPRWKVGPRNHEIKLEDLYLVSMHHVSMGSWQPHLRLRHPFINKC